jgi:hypothetical protein
MNLNDFYTTFPFEDLRIGVSVPDLIMNVNSFDFVIFAHHMAPISYPLSKPFSQILPRVSFPCVS